MCVCVYIYLKFIFQLQFIFNNIMFKDFIYFSKREREEEKEGNINMREKHQSVASCIHPDWGLNPHPRPVP